MTFFNNTGGATGSHKHSQRSSLTRTPFLAAARALLDSPDLSAEDIARKAMNVAADMCVYTNDKFIVEKLESNSTKDETEENK